MRKWWLYQARRVCTRTANNGAIFVRISMNAGQVGKINQAYMLGSATAAGIVVEVRDEDGATNSVLATVSAGVSRTVHLPTSGSIANTNGAIANSKDMLLGPGQFLVFYTDAGPQNGENIAVGLSLLLSVPVTPVWDTTGSTATVSLAASTISTANTMQEVFLPE